MVPYRSFNIDGIWEGKKGFKVIIWEDKPQRRDKFLWGKFSPLDTMLLVQKYRGHLSIQFTVWKLMATTKQ